MLLQNINPGQVETNTQYDRKRINAEVIINLLKAKRLE